jgi:hypothetical protein
MNAPFPPNPCVQPTGNWVWVPAGLRTVVQVFSASARYTPSPDLISCTVECVGGGANGGEAAGITPDIAGGGGGGSGGYSRITLPAALVVGGVDVTIGQGGVLPGGGPNDFGLGGAPTSFGAFCVANGGLGGGGNASRGGLWGLPGSAAPPGVGDLALPGNPGATGTSMVENTFALNAIGGGGGAIWGGGGMTAFTGSGGTAPGNPGLGPGAGGGGAVVDAPSVQADQPGGQGADGICVVTETCGTNMTGSGACQPGQARVAWGCGYD